MIDKRNLDDGVSGPGTLRHTAEETLRKTSDTMPELKDKDIEDIIHELQVHQIELEMQNEELKRVQLELEQSKDKYQDLYHFAPVGYFTLTRKGIITDVNLTGAALLGMPREKLIGRGFSHFVGPENLQQWYQHIVGALIDGATQRLDIWLSTEAGSMVFAHLESVCTPLPPELKGENNGEYMIHMVVSDITERKSTEGALRESEATLRTVLQAVPMGIGLVRDRIFGWTNERLSLMTGYSAVDLLGRSARILYESDEEFNRVGTVKFEQIKVSGMGEVETRWKRKDGSLIDIRLSSSAIVTGDLSRGVVFSATDITERKRGERRLRDSEERYQTVADFTYDWEYWVDSEGNFLYCSPSCERITGYSAKEFIDDPDLMNRIIHPDDCAAMMDHYHNVRKVTPHAVEAKDFRIIRRDGEIRWIGHVCQPVHDQAGQPIGRRGSNSDITDRQMLEEHEKWLATAIEQAAEGVVITDVTGVIQYVNPAEEAISGYSRDELIGQGADIFKSDKHSEGFFTNMWETINSGKVWSGRFINRRKDGTEYHEDNSISPMYNKSGELTNFVAVKHNVTKQLELQEQLFQAQKMEAIGTLAGGFAHDFKNKLQVIDGYVDLILLNKDLPTIVKSDLEVIKQALDGSAELINGMMVFSRRTSVKLEPLNLNKLVVNLRSMLIPVMPKTIGVDLVMVDDLWTVNAAPSHIDQVLMNLVINAKDAMPDGGRLTIKTQNVVLDEDFCRFDPISKPGRYALVTLSDTGKGMDRETVRHIFEPFFTTKEPGKGTGLGLAVVYGIVEQHGGRITCYSEPSIGTTFRIYIPAIIEVFKDLYSEKIEAPKGHGETILLVDDEPNILEVASSLLGRASYRVITASTGKDALEIYAEHRENIRLVILDVIMPGMGGEECLRALLKLDPDVKVLVASGALKPGMATDMKETGARDFVGKPFDMPQLLEKIRKIIDEE